MTSQEMLELPVDTGDEADFRIEEERLAAGTALLVVHGEVDLHSAPELRNGLRSTIEDGTGDVVVDLTQATFLDSTSLGVLLGAMKRLREEHREIRLVVSRPEIRRIFEITLLDTVLPLHGTRAEAVAALPGESG